MNIVVLVIDTLRYDFIGAHGNSWIQTPNLDRLAGRSWVFDNSYAASYPTVPHRTDALTGKPGGPFHCWQPLPFDVLTLPRAAAEGGWCTQLIHDTPHLVNGGHNFDWPFHAWTPVRGAEVDRPWIDDLETPPANWARQEMFDFVDWESWKGNLTCAPYSRANRRRKGPDDWNCARLFATASQFLRDNARREKFLLWVDCFDPHEPWDAPEEFMRRYDPTPGYDGKIDPRSFTAHNNAQMPPEARRRVEAAYAAKVSFMDRCVGGFLDMLDSTGLSRNTAVLLTADHGTNLMADGRFGKGGIVNESVGHTPFMVCVPGGGSGRSGIIVQPMDIFATVMGLAGLPTPDGLDSHDVLAAAREGRRPRELALSGWNAGAWRDAAGGYLFSAFDGQWRLEVAARPEDSRLYRMGGREELGARNGDVAACLHAAAVDEVERRGTDKSLMKWLRGGGKGKFPENARFHDHYPSPPGYMQYWHRIYLGK